jgi:tRNA 2-thiouridine synthesizing protein C
MQADVSTLFLLRSEPLGGTRLRAGLDAVLGFAVFGQSPTVMFSQDAVLALCPRGTGADQGVPDLRKLIDSFPLYDVETIWVDGDSLAQRAVNPARLPAFARIATAEDRRRLIASAPAVLSY